MDRILAVKLLCRINVGRNAVAKQKFHASAQNLSARDSSSSSDSSDSDNEKPKEGVKRVSAKKQPRDEAAKQKTVDLLNDLLSKMDKETFVTKKIDLAMPVKKIVKKPKPPTLEEKLVVAAKEVAQTLGGDVQKKEEELLDKIFTAGTPPQAPPSVKKGKKSKKMMEPERVKVEANADSPVSELSSKIDGNEEIEQKKPKKPKPAAESEPSLSELLAGMKIDKTPKQLMEDDGLPIARSAKVKELAEKFQLRPESIDAKLTDRTLREIPANLYVGARLYAFDKIKPTEVFTTNLSTWEALEQNELKMMLSHPPENYFEEMIQWTEQGILWKFPIDNEQGMEAEQSVHFSEHVFMERHIEDWCPRKGPIRHFMELVCVGLSKNPYLTVEEKKEHIMWYRDYFGDKQELLKEIGAIDKNILPDVPADKQIEA